MTTQVEQQAAAVFSFPCTVHWTATRRILFRFAFCYLLLYYGTSLLDWIPGVSQALYWPTILWQFGMYELAVTLFHPAHAADFVYQTGSGDRMVDWAGNGVAVLLAGAATMVWSVLDRHRPNYRQFEAWLRVVARYALALALMSYGIAKVVPTQFLHLSATRLHETYGNSSPMALLWNFMGFSTAYTVFCGVMELVPALLLLFRRTALPGSLLTFAVLTNVFMLNLCYDVPVKLYSFNLLLLSAYLIAPDARRLWSLFLLNQPVGASTSAELHPTAPTARRFMPMMKFAILCLIFVQLGSRAVWGYRTVRSQPVPPHASLTTRGFHLVQESPYNR